MATVTYIRESKQSISAMKGVINYCCQDKKVYDEISNQRLVSGINCDGENAFSEFLATKKSYKKTNGMNSISKSQHNSWILLKSCDMLWLHRGGVTTTFR